MKIALTTAVIALLIFSGCQTVEQNRSIGAVKNESRSDQESYSLMVGKWYGDQSTSDGGRREQLTERIENGTYVIHFRFHEKNGEIWDQVEAGEWGIAGDIYFSIFKGWIEGDTFYPADPSDSYNRDAYRVIKLDKKEFVYDSVQDGDRYTLERVADDFQL